MIIKLHYDNVVTPSQRIILQINSTWSRGPSSGQHRHRSGTLLGTDREYNPQLLTNEIFYHDYDEK